MNAARTEATGGNAPYACLNRAWRAHYREVRSFLAQRSGNTAEADDLLQEIFVKAVHLGHDFCALDNPRAWLFHVARNLLIDRSRLKKEQVPLPDDLAAEAESATEAIDALTHCLPRVLTELSAEDREAIVLCDLQGMAHKEFAERTGLSLPAAKSRVQRARRRLQAQLVEACQVKFDSAGKVCCFVPRAPKPVPESA